MQGRERCAFFALWPLGPLRSLRSRRPLVALGSLRSSGPLFAFCSRRPLRSRWALLRAGRQRNRGGQNGNHDYRAHGFPPDFYQVTSHRFRRGVNAQLGPSAQKSAASSPPQPADSRLAALYPKRIGFGRQMRRSMNRAHVSIKLYSANF